jgi:hypothetical protein
LAHRHSVDRIVERRKEGTARSRDVSVTHVVASLTHLVKLSEPSVVAMNPPL